MSQSESTPRVVTGLPDKDEHRPKVVRAKSLISELKHSGKKFTFGGAEGELQKRNREEAEEQKLEQLQTEVVIGHVRPSSR